VVWLVVSKPRQEVSITGRASTHPLRFDYTPPRRCHRLRATNAVLNVSTVHGSRFRVIPGFPGVHCFRTTETLMQTPTPPNLDKSPQSMPSDGLVQIPDSPSATSVQINQQPNAAPHPDILAKLGSAKTAYPELNSILKLIQFLGALAFLGSIITIMLGIVVPIVDERGFDNPVVPFLSAAVQFVSGLLLRAVGQMMQTVLDGSLSMQRMELHLRKVWPG
jgi:hypothetical protein